MEQLVTKLNLPERFLNKIKSDLEIIIKNNKVERIVLFGSCARRDMKIDSDVDLLVLTKLPLNRYEKGALASDCEEPIRKVSTDLVFYTQEDYNSSECLLVKQIKKEGMLIWKRN